jgi:rod shape-determining protein MreC
LNVALGSLDRSPPPFFKQGPSALTRLLFFASLSLFAMVADHRFHIAQPVRNVVATVLHPLQTALLVPGQVWANVSLYWADVQQMQALRDVAEKRIAEQTKQLMRVSQLDAENKRLRGLLDLRPQIPVNTLAAETLYEAADPFTRKIVIDQGSTHRVVPGSPVVDEFGILGQVTRVYALTSEVTLLVDSRATVPVVVARTQQRGVAYGQPDTSDMELRFMPANADVQVGDTLQTSGLDGVYPPGLPVATVVHVDRRADSAFARITLKTKAKPDNPRHVLVLHPAPVQVAPMPAPAPPAEVQP